MSVAPYRGTLTKHDWDMVEHYARHGSLVETAAAFWVSQQVVRTRIMRIAPFLLPGCPTTQRLGGPKLRHVTDEYWNTTPQATPAAA